jgi:hypothetical protein
LEIKMSGRRPKPKAYHRMKKFKRNLEERMRPEEGRLNARMGR